MKRWKHFWSHFGGSASCYGCPCWACSRTSPSGGVWGSPFPTPRFSLFERCWYLAGTRLHRAQRPGWKAVRRQRKLPVTQDQSASRRKGCLQRPRSERQIPMAPGTSSEDTSLVECKRWTCCDWKSQSKWCVDISLHVGLVSTIPTRCPRSRMWSCTQPGLFFMAVFILWEETSISAIWPKQSKPQHWCAWSFDHRRGGPTFATARRTFIESVHLDVWYCRLPGVLLEARSMHGLAMAWDFCGSRNAFWRDTMKSRRRSARLSRKRCLYTMIASSPFTAWARNCEWGSQLSKTSNPSRVRYWWHTSRLFSTGTLCQKKKLKTKVGYEGWCRKAGHYRTFIAV